MFANHDGNLSSKAADLPGACTEKHGTSSEARTTQFASSDFAGEKGGKVGARGRQIYSLLAHSPVTDWRLGSELPI